MYSCDKICLQDFGDRESTACNKRWHLFFQSSNKYIHTSHDTFATTLQIAIYFCAQSIFISCEAKRNTSYKHWHEVSMGCALQNSFYSFNLSLVSERTQLQSARNTHYPVIHQTERTQDFLDFILNVSRHIAYPELYGIVREKYTFELFDLLLAKNNLSH